MSVRGKAIRLIKRFREVGSVAEFEFSEILGFFIYNVHIYFRAVSKQFGHLFAVKRGRLEALRKHADIAVCAGDVHGYGAARNVANNFVIAVRKQYIVNPVNGSNDKTGAELCHGHTDDIALFESAQQTLCRVILHNGYIAVGGKTYCLIKTDNRLERLPFKVL